jgi:lipoate-protein ligase A
VEFSEGDLTLSEHARYQAALREIDTPDWVNLVARPRSDLPILEAVRKFPGGILRASVAFDVATRTIRQVWFSGDIFVNPRRTIADLEAALRDLPLERLAAKIEWFFASRPVDMLSLTPADFVTVVRLAVGQPLIAQGT